MVSASTPRFNVVTHGLMWFREVSVSGKKLWRAYIPEVTNHFYLIGKVATPDLELNRGPDGWPGPIGHGKTYELQFASRDEAPIKQVDPNRALVLRDSTHGRLEMDEGKLHATIQVPIPNEVTVLRWGKKPTNGTFFKGRAADQLPTRPARLGLVHVLSYLGVVDPTAKVDGKLVFDSTDNLHIYAEPSSGEVGNHFPYLIGVLKPPIQLQTTKEGDKVEAPDYDPAGDDIGVGKADQKSLAEVSGHGFSRPTNCMSAFLLP